MRMAEDYCLRVAHEIPFAFARMHHIDTNAGIRDCSVSFQTRPSRCPLALKSEVVCHGSLEDQRRMGADTMSIGPLIAAGPGWHLVGGQGAGTTVQPLERHLTRLGVKTIEFRPR